MRWSYRTKPSLPRTKGEWMSYIDNRLEVDEAEALCHKLGLDTADAVLAPDYVRVIRDYVEDDLGDDNAVIVFPSQRVVAHTHAHLMFIMLATIFTLGLLIIITVQGLDQRPTRSELQVNNGSTAVVSTTTVPPRTNPSVAPATTTTLKPTTTVPATTTTTDCVPMPGKSSKQLSNGICLYS